MYISRLDKRTFLNLANEMQEVNFEVLENDLLEVQGEELILLGRSKEEFVDDYFDNYDIEFGNCSRCGHCGHEKLLNALHIYNNYNKDWYEWNIKQITNHITTLIELEELEDDDIIDLGDFYIDILYNINELKNNCLDIINSSSYVEYELEEFEEQELKGRIIESKF